MGKIPCTTIKSPEGDPPHICPPSFFVHLVYKFLHKNFINFHKYIQYVYAEPKLLDNSNFDKPEKCKYIQAQGMKFCSVFL